MTYTPAFGDRILVRRVYPSGRVGTMTGTVRDIVTLHGSKGDIDGVLRFDDDNVAGCASLGTIEQMAAVGVTQTYEPLPDGA